MDKMKNSGVDVKLVCESMTRAIAIDLDLIYRLECDENVEEIMLLREQARCCLRTLAQVQNLDEIARYEEGRIHPVCFSASEWVEDIVDMTKQRLRRSRIKIKSDIQKGIVSYADPDRFAVCILNLVVNALQNVSFEEGEITVSLKKYFDFISCSVIDNGYGMTNQELDRCLKDGGGASGFDVLRRFCESVGCSPIFETTENGGFSVTVRLPLPPEGDGEVELNSDIRRGLQVTPLSSALLYKFEETEVFF